MKLSLELEGKSYQVMLPGHSIAIGLDFNQAQPNTYGVPGATAKAYEQDGWVGDVRRGGSCNFDTYTLTPHCNGTHTECIGHITADRMFIHRQLQETLIPTTLVSISPVIAGDSNDEYDPVLGEEDRLIDRASLEKAFASCGPEFRKALVIRTLPNEEGKLTRDYMEKPPAFFSLQAMQLIREAGVQHLLVDMPSVDRLFDEGKLSTHHLFWEISGDGSGQLDGPRMYRTITEMVFVPDHLVDGPYLLNLQVAPFLSDAAPSRPFLYDLNAT